MRRLQNQQPFVLMFQTNSLAARLCVTSLSGSSNPIPHKTHAKRHKYPQTFTLPARSPFSGGCARGGHPGRVKRRDGAPSESVSQGALRTSLPSPQRCDVNAAPQAAPEREQSAGN